MPGNGPLWIRVDSTALLLSIGGVTYDNIGRGRPEWWMPDISQDHVHFFSETIQLGIPDRLVCELGLDLQPVGMSDSTLQQDNQRDDPTSCSQVHDDISLLEGHKFRQKDGIDGKPISLSGLDQL